MKPLVFFALACLATALPCSGFAIDNSAALDQILSKNGSALEPLLNQSPEVRQAILEASLYPNTLDEIDRRQVQTRQQFQNLISSYPRKTQEKFYNLIRYPELVEALVDGGEKSKDQIKGMTKDYPKEVQAAAMDLGRKEYPVLNNMHALYVGSQRDFETVIGSLPGAGQSAFRTLLGYPEVLDTLSDNRNLVTALGEAYRSDPDGAIAKLTEWNQKTAQNNQEALADYRQTLQNDPKAREELQSSAKDFAQYYGYSDSYDSPPSNDSGYSGNTVVNINVNPYPYWFGYPTWYVTPFWRPYPLWALTGFYGWGSSYYVWGFPSYYYTNWFYRYPSNFYRYPYLAGCYGNNYYRYRNYPAYNGFYSGVRSWHNYRRDRINDDLWRNDNYRSDRWRDFGHREEVQQRRYSGRHPSWNPRDWKDRGGDRHDWDRDKNRHGKDRWDHDKGRHGKGGWDRDKNGDGKGKWDHDKNRHGKGGWDQDKNGRDKDKGDQRGRHRGPSFGDKGPKDDPQHGKGYQPRGGDGQDRKGWNQGRQDKNPDPNRDRGHYRRAGNQPGGKGSPGQVSRQASPDPKPSNWNSQGSSSNGRRAGWNSGNPSSYQSGSSWSHRSSPSSSSSWGSNRSFGGSSRSSFGGGHRGGGSFHSGGSRGRR